MTVLIIVGAIAAILYFTYVGLIKKRNAAMEALSGIDVQLKMRHDLIPNILTIAEKYMEHEKDLIGKVTELRAQAGTPYDTANPAAVSEHFSVASQLGAQMGKLQVSMEAYPTLQADQPMMESMRAYRETEALIAAARRSYNASVTTLNNAVQIFPGSMLAPSLGIRTFPFFETDEASKAPVIAKDYLG